MLFHENEVSVTDAVDALCEAHVYSAQTFAREQMLAVFKELNRRERICPSALAWRIDGQRIVRDAEWSDKPSHGFCVALSLANGYKTWLRSFGQDYTEQGELFERLTETALGGAGFDVLRTGWSIATPNTINAVVSNISTWLGERPGHPSDWTSEQAKEAGVDMVCRFSFQDARPAAPVYLMQCASGTGWQQKLGTPVLEIWSKLVDFTVDPDRAFAHPFVTSDAKDFRISVRKTGGIFLDRTRLLAGAQRQGLPGQLSADLQAWTASRIATLPLDS